MALAWLVLVGALAAGVALAQRWGPPRETWSLADVVLVFGLLLGAGGLIGGAVGRLWWGSWMPQEHGLVVGILGTALASALVMAAIGRRASLRALGFVAPPQWSIGAALVGVPLFLWVSAAWALALEALDVGFESQHILLALATASPLERGLALGYGAVMAPIVEEVLFRGFLLPPLARRAGEQQAVVWGGLLFGVVHMTDPFAVVPLVVLGSGLGWLRWRSGSLWPAILLHSANNTIALVMAMHGEPAAV